MAIINIFGQPTWGRRLHAVRITSTCCTGASGVWAAPAPSV